MNGGCIGAKTGAQMDNWTVRQTDDRQTGGQTVQAVHCFVFQFPSILSLKSKVLRVIL
jgi:hypothetical protein